VLASLLRDPLVVVDVGCRWGFADRWARLGDRCISIGFDPDADECARLAARYGNSTNVRLVPLALGPERGKATLYKTKDPGGYSILPTVEDVVERHPSLEGGRVEGTTTIDLTTLDVWCEDEAVERVDVIKIDTQGSELGVLEGAGRVLGSVRAVEAEVEFNPLYEGVGLFSEVDRFLRARGFVLWRLRDLAHYAQRGAPPAWQVEESQWFDSHEARFAARSGQLFWANAYFVKSEVAYPDATRGCDELVRDACVTGALGFGDLATLAVAAARETAPRETREVLATALSEDATRSAQEHALAAESAALAEPVTIEADDSRFSGWGWREPQRVDLGAVRWTGPPREASIDLPFTLAGGARVELLVVGAMSDAILAGLALEANRVPLVLSRTPHDYGVVVSSTLPADYSSRRPFTRLVLRTPATVPWNELHPDSDDDVELGVAVSWLRLTP
jgi:FkbM family methyltransferase